MKSKHEMVELALDMSSNCVITHVAVRTMKFEFRMYVHELVTNGMMSPAKTCMLEILTSELDT